MGHFSMETNAPTGSNLSANQHNDIIRDLIDRVERIDILQDALKVQMKDDLSDPHTDESNSEGADIISIPWTKPSMSRKRQIVGQSDDAISQRPMRSETRSKLLKGIAQGRIWLDLLIHIKSESIATISERHSLSEKTVRSTLSLALLAPDIVDAAIEGRLPRSLTTTQMLNLPGDWQEQSKVLGLI